MSRLIDGVVLDGAMSPHFAGRAKGIAFHRHPDGRWEVRKDTGYAYEDAYTKEPLTEADVLERCKDFGWPSDVRIVRDGKTVAVTATRES